MVLLIFAVSLAIFSKAAAIRARALASSASHLHTPRGSWSMALRFLFGVWEKSRSLRGGEDAWGLVPGLRVLEVPFTVPVAYLYRHAVLEEDGDAVALPALIGLDMQDLAN